MVPGNPADNAVPAPDDLPVCGARAEEQDQDEQCRAGHEGPAGENYGGQVGGGGSKGFSGENMCSNRSMMPLKKKL